MARPQGLAQAAVERVVVPLLADLQFLPIGPDVAEHQAAGSIAVIRKEMPRRFRTCRSSKMANTTPGGKTDAAAGRADTLGHPQCCGQKVAQKEERKGRQIHQGGRFQDPARRGFHRDPVARHGPDRIFRDDSHRGTDHQLAASAAAFGTVVAAADWRFTATSARPSSNNFVTLAV